MLKMRKRMDAEFKLEIRRQAFHAAVGIAAVFLVIKGLAGVYFFALLSIAGLLLSFFSVKHRIPVICQFLKIFDRKKERIPGKGAILLIVGIAIALTFFPQDIAIAAIAVLAIGDAISRLGQFFGKVHFPWNRHKQIESTFLGFLGSAIFASLFVTGTEAVAASATAMFAESFPINARGRTIDDNLVVPVVAGFTITLLRLL